MKLFKDVSLRRVGNSTIHRQKEAKSPVSACASPLSRDLAVCPCQRTEWPFIRDSERANRDNFSRSISEIDGERRKSRFASKTRRMINGGDYSRRQVSVRVPLTGKTRHFNQCMATTYADPWVFQCFGSCNTFVRINS